MLLVAVTVLAVAMAVLWLALRRAAGSRSPAVLHGSYQSAVTAANDLDLTVAEFRAAVDDRADR